VEFEDCSATFETAWILPETYPHVVDFGAMLLGTKERIGLDPLPPLVDASGERYEWPITGAMQEIHGRMTGWQLLPILHFADALVEERAPMVTPEEGLHNTAVICAIERSILSGKPEPVGA
jgi:predicted dehydrogenase